MDTPSGPQAASQAPTVQTEPTLRSKKSNTPRGSFGVGPPANTPPRSPKSRGPRRDHRPGGSSQERNDLVLPPERPAGAGSHRSTSAHTQHHSTSRQRKSTNKESDSTLSDVVQSTPTASTPTLNAEEHQHQHQHQHQPPPASRRARFNGHLNEQPNSLATSSVTAIPSERYKGATSQHDDLTSTLTHALSTPPFPDCPICFFSIRPAQHTWSCSPLVPVLSSAREDRDGEQPVVADKDMSKLYCWTTFHLKCIGSWATKSVKEVADAWRARGEDRGGEWRCPGCQTKRDTVPSGYWCFCGSTPDPKLSHLATPHSCGGPCSRTRGCGHPCTLSCHPGPCPPCQVKLELRCHCGRRPLPFKCFHLAKDSSGTSGTADLSCGGICGKKLGCGTHRCQEACHPGSCEPCGVTEVGKCYCGRVERELRCGEGEAIECTLNGDAERSQQKWVGMFSCDNKCNRYFDCGIHLCSKSCHPPSPDPPTCPRSPSLVTQCPCGKQNLSWPDTSAFPPNTLLARRTCSDPIPTCNSMCMKPLADCSHVCSAKCHTGPCPPCTIMLVRPCRCGASTKYVPCSSMMEGSHEDILCDRPCPVLRDCGKHQCNRVCCPLASLASGPKGKGKKRTGVADQAGISETGLHECDLVCGKLLICGTHRCEERDHRGICPPCLRSSFEEMICNCGRTVVEPPISCGTQIHCTYPCTRPPHSCGHPLVQHACHEDPSACPPCPFLTGKTCACGKKVVENVRCSQEKVSCGTACGKPLTCGFHHCERLCHSDGCGLCASLCGKPLKLCLPASHPCPLPCHAPSACPELEPCRSVITLSCPCGRIRQPVPCGRCSANPSGRESTQQPKCSNECNVAKRNARLADALGINTDNRTNVSVSYSEELVAFARVNPKLLSLVEKAFANFVSSEKRTQVLPHMPADRRKFVSELATVYRMDTQIVDQEPHRSVQIFRRIDTRIPNILLSQVLLSSPPPVSLGKLADLRSPSAQQQRRSPVPAPNVVKPAMPSSSAGSMTTQRGWTAVVARSGASTPTPTTPVVSSVVTANPGTASSAGNGSRSRTQPANLAIPLSVATTELDVKVPDNWEDDDELSR